MQICFAGAVGMHCIQDHAECSEQSHECGKESDISNGEACLFEQDCGRGERVGVGSEYHAEEQQADLQDSRVEQRPAYVGAVNVGSGLLFQLALEPAFLLLREPLGVSGSVRQKKKKAMLRRTGGAPSTRNSHCQPAEPELPVKVEESARENAHDHSAQWQGDVEAADGAGTHVRWKPLHEIEEHAGEKTRLCHSEQKSHDIELQWSSDKHHADGDDAPGKHDAGEPLSRTEAEEQ